MFVLIRNFWNLVLESVKYYQIIFCVTRSVQGMWWTLILCCVCLMWAMAMMIWWHVSDYRCTCQLFTFGNLFVIRTKENKCSCGVWAACPFKSTALCNYMERKNPGKGEKNHRCRKVKRLKNSHTKGWRRQTGTEIHMPTLPWKMAEEIKQDSLAKPMSVQAVWKELDTGALFPVKHWELEESLPLCSNHTASVLDVLLRAVFCICV